MTRTRRPSPHTPSVDGQNEGSNRSMTKKKNTPAQRVGAAALATATVVSGLAFGPGAVAVPASDQNGTSAGSPSVSSSAESTRLVGPLAIVVSETVAYGLRADADTMRTLSAGNLEHAQAEADYWSVPAVGEVGPVRGVGEDSERCLLKSGTPTNAGIVLMATCDGSAAQNWQWTDITTMQGFSKGLSPAAETSRAIGSRGAGSFVHAVTGSFRHPMALDDAMKAERELTASATGVPGQISGVGTTGATVSARGESVVVSDDGTYTLSLPGLSTAPTSVEVTQTLPNGDVQDTVDVEVTGTGPLAPVEMAPVEVARGGERAVTFEAKVADELLSRPAAEVTLTAPEGMTFAEGQDEITGAYIRDGRPSPGGMQLTAGERSADGRTYTYTWDTVANGATGWQSPQDEILRWQIAVVTPSDAADVDGNTMGYSLVGTSTQGAFEATGAAPVSVVDEFGTITGVEVAPTVLQRGEDTAVSFVVENTEARSALNPTVTLTAPEGTTFTPDTTVEAEWRTTGTSTWNNGGNMRMTDVTISDDGRTLTGTKASGTVGSPQEFKFTVMVSTAADAADVADNALGFVYEGTSSAGAFRATGTAPVSIAGDFGGFTSVDVESTSLTPGARGELSFVVENDSAREGFAPVVTLTAPEGVTFASESLIRGEYRYIDDEAWNEGLNLRLTDISISDDGRTLTGTRAATNVGGGQHFRYTAAVQVADDAAVGPTSGMGFVYEGTSSTGAFHTAGTAPVSIVQAYAPVTLDNFGDGDTFTPGDVTFSGTGTPGATVTVAPSTGVGVSTEVRSDGTWSAVRYLGNAAYTMSVSQTAASGENTIQNIRLFSDAVVEQDFSVTSPAAGAGHTQQGWVTFTGQGTTWSTVSISDGSDVPATTATVQYDGTWSARRWVGTEKTTFTVTSSRADVQNGSQTIEFNTGVSGQEFSLDSHTDGGTFTPGNVTFRGKGSTGDEVTFTAPGLAPMEATVNAAGEWSVPRWLGNGFITFTVTHTPVTGDATQQTLRLFSDQVAQGDLTVTAPLDGAGHDQPGWVTFTGTGTTWSTVSISDGTTAAPSTATVQYDGSWTVNRWVGTARTTFTVSSERAGIAQGSETIEFNAGESDGEFAISSHTDGGTFTPGNVTIAGTGTAGDEVTLSAAGLAPIEIEVDERGYWSTSRWLGNGFISFTVTHTPVSGAETTHTLRLYSDQVAQGDLTVTSPLDGASHTAAGFVTFTGTGTTWSKVSVSDGTNAAPSVATVQYDGSWTVRRWVGTAPVTFTVASERADIENGSQTIRFNTAD